MRDKIYVAGKSFTHYMNKIKKILILLGTVLKNEKSEKIKKRYLI